MSLSRALFNEFRPFFHMMDDPFSMDPDYSALSRQRRADPYNWQSTTPALNLSEENDTYIIEAEVPGVRKENLDLKVGDGGRSLTIEGRVFSRQHSAGAGRSGEAKEKAASPPAGKSSDAVARTDDSNKQVATSPESSGVRTFTRTVWLPQRVDANNIEAKLDHGDRKSVV